MKARTFYAIVDTQEKCLVLVRPDAHSVEVIGIEEAAAMARTLAGTGDALADEVEGAVNSLTLAELAARLCGTSEGDVRDAVSTAEGMALGSVEGEGGTSFADLGLCIAVTPPEAATAVATTISRAERGGG